MLRTVLIGACLLIPVAAQAQEGSKFYVYCDLYDTRQPTARQYHVSQAASVSYASGKLPFEINKVIEQRWATYLNAAGIDTAAIGKGQYGRSPQCFIHNTLADAQRYRDKNIAELTKTPNYRVNTVSFKPAP